ncbi:MAG TPA: SOS response-associated peptidase [Gemmataceae bacterium]|jgi:putative SOS response-associated peptidase YedK
MCARITYRLNQSLQEMAELMLGDDGPDGWLPTPGYNICPTQMVAAVRVTADAGRRELVPLKWGLIPSWSKDPKIASSCINARAETVATKPAFRSAFKRRRCLLLADGYYEWTGKPGKKQPWHFRFPDDRVFAFAGLWECWNPPEREAVETCTIVTTAANELAATYHDRMPVILDPGDYARWLDPAAPTDRLLPLLESRPVDGLLVAAANPLVNNPRNQGPELLVPPSAEVP